jgi:Rieske Fe-S protein
MTLASGGLAVGSIGLAVYSRFPREQIAFEPKMICKVQDVPPNGSLAFTYPRETDLCILVQKQNGKFAAFSRRCTHLSCPVVWQGRKDRLYCPCHNGAFSAADGSVLQGPPPHALPRIDIEVRGDVIWAVGVSRGAAS